MKRFCIRALNIFVLAFILVGTLTGIFSALVASADDVPQRSPQTPSQNFPQTTADWLQTERSIAVTKMFANISPWDGMPGAVVASPSRTNPDYYYHWVRDAGLVMDTVGRLYQSTHQSSYKDTLYQYAYLSRVNQVISTQAGMGEPKFNVDGSAFNGPWGRPQNDGPALRALALIRFATILLGEGEEVYVRTKLYDSQIPTQSVIKADLEYVAYHWRDGSFDLWEETKGDHFYTRMVQRKALIFGAELARRLGDYGASDFYVKEAQNIRGAIDSHWDGNRQLLIPTLNRTAGLDYKYSDLDIAILLGVLHGYAGDGYMSVSDYRVQATLQKITDSFARIYSINRRGDIPGIAIGRYPEDRYGGNDFNAGNPWVLCTLAVAEGYYMLEREWRQNGRKQDAEHARELADQYVGRVRFHANPDGSLSEQMQRDTGYMISARDLTWNYAAVLTTSWARGE